MIRYSSRPLPNTAFVPGVSARSDRPSESPARGVIDLDALADNEDFRYGIDLFNHGFPWEAHEAWEPLWFAAPRDRPERALLQGLIHAAAAVLKARTGAVGPARGFVESACEHLALVSGALIDTRAFAASLRGWAHDPSQQAPTLSLSPADAPLR